MKNLLIPIILILNVVILFILLSRSKKENFCVSCSPSVDSNRTSKDNTSDQSISTAYLSQWQPSPCAYNMMAYY